METKIRIRLANAGDLNAVYDLICEMQGRQLDKRDFEYVMIEYLLRADIRLWVADAGDETVGVLSMHILQHLHHAGKIAEVVELAVAPAWRSKGIGRKLLAEAEIAACQAGCKMLELSTSMKRERAQQFYLREGMNKSHFKFTREL